MFGRSIDHLLPVAWHNPYLQQLVFFATKENLVKTIDRRNNRFRGQFILPSVGMRSSFEVIVMLVVTASTNLCMFPAIYSLYSRQLVFEVRCDPLVQIA